MSGLQKFRRLGCRALLAAAFGCACTPAFADNNATAAATNIVRSGTLAKLSDLNYGYVVPGTAASYIRIPATSDTVVLDSGNATLAGGTITRAQFHAVTLPLNLITIQLPTTATMTRVGGTETITLDNFTHNLTGGFLGIYNVLNDGTLQFAVGARMRVVPNQTQGTYRGTFTVTANYL